MTEYSIIRGGIVVDGSGSPPAPADVIIRGDRILDIVPPCTTVEGALVIDGEGAVVTPGFIDAHVHSDYLPFLDERENSLRHANLLQGVTTEICGNCGFSAFPVAPDDPGNMSPRLATILGQHGRPFPDLDAYRDAVEQSGMASNIATLVGHNTVRGAAIGAGAAGPSHLRRMSRMVEEGLEQGAVGVSSGLIYQPGRQAGLAELVSFARPAARRGLPYSTHLRSEARDVASALDEAITVSLECGAPLHVSHLKVAGRPYWDSQPAILARLVSLRERGFDVTADAYPYTAGSTGLTACLPPWVDVGGSADLLARVASARCRRRIARDIDRGLPGWPNPVGADGWQSVFVATSVATPEAQGRSIADLASAMACREVDAACELLIANEGQVTIVIHAMSPENVEAVLSQSFVMLGSDGLPQPGRPHPRYAGTFARWLGKFIRERQLVSLAEGVRRCTSMTAERFRLQDRGRLAPGYIADLAVIEMDLVSDLATYDEPLTPPIGVRHVMVSGRLAVRNGSYTGRRDGRVLSPS